MYFLKGRLPWQGLRGNTKKEKYRRIMNKKVNTPLDELCSDLPSIFEDYLNYCRGLRFNETPDYRYLRNLFIDYMKKEGIVDDGVYDWIAPRTEGAFKPWELSSLFVSDGKLLFGLDQPGRRELRDAMLKSGECGLCV